MIIPLTSLRGLAAFAVMGYHFAPLLHDIPIFNRGFLGVDLFFLLSGFILTHVYNNQLNIRSFLSARIARTYPLHLFTLHLLLLPAFGRGEAFSATALACNLTMTQVLCGGVAQLEFGIMGRSVPSGFPTCWFPFLLRPMLTCPRWVRRCPC